ncbi:MAG: uracil-DNA glycosylase, partial [Dehalococcoidales bacterium]|nr:uracil-DNA glycosylase [Dehalococcoidales bacterium]
FLDHLLALIHLQRSQVYIANVIKCRPPANREPLPVEIQNCRNWLDSQVKAIHPKMIVTLGRYSMSGFFPDKAISKVHGTAQRQNGVIYFFMYHPAAALHQQSLRQSIEADMLKIPSCLAEVQQVQEIREVNQVNPQPRQLGLF